MSKVYSDPPAALDGLRDSGVKGLTIVGNNAGGGPSRQRSDRAGGTLRT